MTQETKDEIKRYLISSGVTFCSSMIVILYANIELFKSENVENGVLLALFATAARGAVKVVMETIIIPALQKLIGVIK
jgi:hypothetical protein